MSITLLIYLFICFTLSIVLVWFASILMLIRRKILCYLPIFVIGVLFCFAITPILYLNYININFTDNVDLSISFTISSLFIILSGVLIFNYLKRQITLKEIIYFFIILISLLFHIFIDVYSYFYGYELVLFNFFVDVTILPVSLMFMYLLYSSISPRIGLAGSHDYKKKLIRLSKLSMSFYLLFLVICTISDLILLFSFIGVLDIVHSVSMLGITISLYFVVVIFLIGVSKDKKTKLNRNYV